MSRRRNTKLPPESARKPGVSRRAFIKHAALTGAGAALLSRGVWSSVAAAEPKGANEKLDIACIGTANRAAADIDGVQSQNIVALCDIDDNYLGGSGKRFPKANKYNDFRKLLETEKKLDAVVVGTADHTHAPASVMAMKLGKHCYCEKPLTHTVHEARIVAQTAREAKVATQMGTQIHAGNNYRRVVELIQSGAIGPVSEVHVWVGKGWGGGELPAKADEVPPNLHWDLWLGPAPERPYAAGRYHPANWRKWWAFGNGTLGDMGCHYMDLPFWALGLRHPTAVAAEGPAVNPETCPLGLKVVYDFPARDKNPAVKLTWYDGHLNLKQLLGRKLPNSGVMFVGEKGQLLADYDHHTLLPEDKFHNFQAPEPTIPNSIGHHNEWIKACKDGSPTTCNFDYAGALSETVLLGNVAYRCGKKIEWDAENLKVTNVPEANQYIQKEYRKGWTL